MGNMANFENEFLKSPEKFGFCSFDEFRKNKDRWRARPEQTLESIAGAGTLHKDRIRKVKYEMEGYACDSVEGVQALSRQMGFRDSDLVFFPVPHNHLAGKFDILVRVFHKDTVKRRDEQCG
jgi:hypothetical protein